MKQKLYVNQVISVNKHQVQQLSDQNSQTAVKVVLDSTLAYIHSLENAISSVRPSWLSEVKGKAVCTIANIVGIDPTIHGEGEDTYLEIEVPEEAQPELVGDVI